MIVVHYADTVFTCDHMRINEDAHTASFFYNCSNWTIEPFVFDGVIVSSYEIKRSCIEIYLEKCDEEDSGC